MKANYRNIFLNLPYVQAAKCPGGALSIEKKEQFSHVIQTFHDIITVDPDIQFGKPVFKGTRIPIQTLFWHLEAGYSIDAFIAEFPSLNKSQVELFLNLTGNLFEKMPTSILDETIA